MTGKTIPAPTGTLYYQIEEDGPLYVAKNQIVSTYRNVAAKALAGSGTITHFALGGGSTAAAKGQTALISETYRASVTERTAGSTTVTIKYRFPSNAGNGVTYREAGLFDAASGGNMFARIVLSSPIDKTSSIAPLFSWVITLADAP